MPIHRVYSVITALIVFSFSAYAEAPATYGTSQSYKPPAHHAEMERLAREFGYTGGRLMEKENPGYLKRDPTKNELMPGRNPDVLSTKGDDVFRRQLTDAGYKLKEAIDDRKTGMQAIVVENKKGEHFIVFRGTEPSDPGDLKTDAQAIIGENQYATNKATLDAWSEKYPDATVIGHSLGGALAQHYIQEHPEKVKEAVLFNSPGISQGEADKFDASDKKPPITYYLGSGDPVSELGGETHLRGKIVIAHGGKVDPTHPQNGTLPEHRGTMLQKDSGTNLNEYKYSDYQKDRLPIPSRLIKVANDALGLTGKRMQPATSRSSDNQELALKAQAMAQTLCKEADDLVAQLRDLQKHEKEIWASIRDKVALLEKGNLPDADSVRADLTNLKDQLEKIRADKKNIHHRMKDLYQQALNLADAAGLSSATGEDKANQSGNKTGDILSGKGTWTAFDGQENPITLTIDLGQKTFSGESSAHTERYNDYGDFKVFVKADSKGILNGKFTGDSKSGTLEGHVAETLIVITNGKSETITDTATINATLDNNKITGTLGQHPFRVTIQ